MKILKRILIVIVAFVALILIVALFVKGEFDIQRSVVINKPKNEVYDYIKYLKNQNEYSKWAKMDPNMKTEFRGTDGTVGFVSAWESQADSVGKGEQEIKGIEPGKRIDYEIRFIKPFAAVAPAYMALDSTGVSQTKVTWNFHEKMPYPMNIMCLFMDIEKMIGADLQTGLNNLKAILEKQ
ncbi:polyketide cyclase [Mucilaginibacter limnophilus]|uniref:Polyketide cyclase n=1 Tax=Mucilaginibacter limnophilus TaxID=1932778 RepID=A0A437MUP9_9SPHI|nr:SRPBCC family protein [Mucilaginibacter limnophilus]RVU01404.1 polyketide cyclase [Mucilaginibacter limnophilus]